MNTKNNNTQSREITIPVLCALTWINAVLSGVILMQQQTPSLQQQAYLLGRSPADFAMMHDAATKIALNDTDSSSAGDVPEVSARSSVPSSAPYLDIQPEASSSSASPRGGQAASFIPAPSVSSRSSVEPAHPAASEPASASSVDTFPAFGNAVMPVTEVPNWGAMTTPAEWNRSYAEMGPQDFVKIPPYNLSTLTIPVKSLEDSRNDPHTIATLTAKLFYSTRFFGSYDIDATEFTAVHPGIDLKLADGTPIGAVAGGRVHDVRHDENSLGIHVIIEHRAPDGSTFYSIYGHLAMTKVKTGDTVTAGQMIGIVGMTGNTSGPHLHWQIDRGEPNETYHSIYWPQSIPSSQEADKFVINPITFIQKY